MQTLFIIVSDDGATLGGEEGSLPNMQPAFEEQIAYRRDGHIGKDPDIDVLA